MESNNSAIFDVKNHIPSTSQQSDGILKSVSPEPPGPSCSSHTSNHNILGYQEELVVNDTIKIEIESPSGESDQENDMLYTDMNPLAIKPDSKYLNCSVVEVEVEFESPRSEKCLEYDYKNSKEILLPLYGMSESKDVNLFIKVKKDSNIRQRSDFNNTDKDIRNESNEIINVKSDRNGKVLPQIATTFVRSVSPCGGILVKEQIEMKSEFTDTIHTEKRTFICSVCNKCFIHKSDLTRHSLVHSKERPFSCTKCSKCFSQKSHFTTHMLFHSGKRPFICSICNKNFAQNSDLNRHMLIHAEKKENPYTCAICDSVFSQKSLYQEHIMLIHSGEQLFSCRICSKSFGRNSDLARHMFVHSDKKPYLCTVCNKCFSQKSVFTKHVMIHSGEQPFSCSICSKRFGRKTDLKRHTLVHSGEKPFACTVCSKSFSQKAHFTSHMFSHSGDKPFCCSICNNFFTRKADLKTHMMIHSGEKPFKCSLCSKSYSRKAKLVHHMLVHS